MMAWVANKCLLWSVRVLGARGDKAILPTHFAVDRLRCYEAVVISLPIAACHVESQTLLLLAKGRKGLLFGTGGRRVAELLGKCGG